MKMADKGFETTRLQPPAYKTTAQQRREMGMEACKPLNLSLPSMRRHWKLCLSLSTPHVLDLPVVSQHQMTLCGMTEIALL